MRKMAVVQLICASVLMGVILTVQISNVPRVIVGVGIAAGIWQLARLTLRLRHDPPPDGDEAVRKRLRVSSRDR